jgi:tRNA pseudouridine synthase 10
LILDDVRKMLTKYPLCDNCLGRQFGGLARGVSNRDRGFSLKLALAMESHLLLRKGDSGGEEVLKVLASNGGHGPASNVVGNGGGGHGCFVCEGLIEKIGEYAAEVVEKLKAYQFATFLMGVKVTGEMAEREDRLKAEFGIEFGESIKMEFSREVGKEVSRRAGKEVEFNTPDVVVLLDLSEGAIRVRPMPLFIFGRYRKLVRGLPQSRWDCVHCGGRGCEVCHGTGKIYQTSVEEIVVGPILAATEGRSAKFHGAGREDVDAIMVGTGRPFVVEVREPHNRRPDLGPMAAAINEAGGGKVEVEGLRFSDRKTVRSLKEKAKVAEKTYRALVEVDKPFSDEALVGLEKSFNGCFINQYTPKRVMHRRADKLRVKKVHEMKARRVDGSRMELVIRGQGGLYIKELISGDEGRTKPSVSEALGAGARCVELDVISVKEAT